MANNFNENITSDFLRVLFALKANVMRDTNNVDVCQLTKQSTDGRWLATSITDRTIMTLDYLSGLSLKTDDFVVVIFSDRDYRTNLIRMNRGLKPIYQDEQTLHSKSYGIIIGKLA